MSEALFYFFGAVAVISALAMVFNVRNTVAAAMSLVVTMIALAAIYVQLEAHFVAALQIMIYGGAIVVLFVFVVMLLNLRADDFAPPRQRLVKLAGLILGVLVLFQFVQLLPGALPETQELTEGFGGYREVGRALYSDYVLAFETTSILLLSAIVGAVVLAKRRLD